VGHPIEERLRAVLVERPSRELQDESEDALVNDLIARAVAEDPPEDRYDEVEKNFRLLVQEAEAEAESRGITVGNEAFEAAMLKLCPIWPFC
jgi:hypothetical protein